ncbi:MAG: hypothetical protein JST12_18785 [Armatimonadetes bacterium]|nr:hypothetical protein [Armatimonadota bacterium]
MTTKWRRRWASAGRVSLVVLVLLLGSVVIAYQSTDLPSAAGQYEQNRLDAANLGLLFTHDQVRQLYQVPADENGASLVLAAKIPSGSGPTVVAVTTLADKVRAIEPQLQSLEQAVRKKHILFDHDTDDALFVGSSGSNLRSWIKYLTETAAPAIEQGDLAVTRRLLTIAAGLVAHSDEDKTRLALMTRAEVSQQMENQIRLIIERHGMAREWTALARDLAQSLDRPYDFRSAINLEHYANVEFIRELEADPFTLRQAYLSREYPWPVRYSNYLPKFYKAALSRIHARYLTTYRALPSDPNDLAGARKACSAGDDYLTREGISYAGLKTYDEEFGQFLAALEKEAPMRNAVFMAIAKLDGASDTRHALDIDDKPIRVLADRVYSIWQDGHDDGGKPVVDGHGDWVIRMPTR